MKTVHFSYFLSTQNNGKFMKIVHFFYFLSTHNNTSPTKTSSLLPNR